MAGKLTTPRQEVDLLSPVYLSRQGNVLTFRSNQHLPIMLGDDMTIAVDKFHERGKVISVGNDPTEFLIQLFDPTSEGAQGQM